MSATQLAPNLWCRRREKRLDSLNPFVAYYKRLHKRHNKMTRPHNIKRTTMRDIANRLGYSVSTVSRALGDFPAIGPETRERIRKAAESSHFIKNEVARGLALRSSRIISLFIPDIANAYYAEMARGALDVAQQNEYVLTVFNTGRKPEKEELFFRSIISMQSDGLILTGGVTEERHLQILLDHAIPFVLAGRRASSVSAPAIAIDHVSIGYKGTQYLIGLDHRKILFLGGPADSSAAAGRKQGYLDAMRGAGLEPIVRPGDFQMESGVALASELVANKKNVTAVFAANDAMAIGVLLEMGSQGVKIGRDLAILGCDDIPLARLVKPALSTIRVPTYDIGARSMKMLLSLVKGEQEQRERTVLVGCELIVRESAAGPPLPGPVTFKKKK